MTSKVSWSEIMILHILSELDKVSKARLGNESMRSRLLKDAIKKHYNNK
jgi:hypothetical protein